MVKFVAIFVAFAVAVVGAGCADPRSAKSESLLQDDSPDLPRDAAVVSERLAGCKYLTREIGTSPPERKLELAQALQRLRCDQLDQDAAAIRAKYADNAQILNVLAAADQL